MTRDCARMQSKPDDSECWRQFKGENGPIETSKSLYMQIFASFWTIRENAQKMGFSGYEMIAIKSSSPSNHQTNPSFKLTERPKAILWSLPV